MRNGDISNRGASTILVRVGGTVIERKQKTSLRGLFNKEHKYETNFETLTFLMRTFLHSDYKIELLMDADLDMTNKEIYSKILEDQAIPGIVRTYNMNQVNHLINSGVYTCYIDNDINQLNKVTSPYCFSVAEANKFIR